MTSGGSTTATRSPGSINRYCHDRCPFGAQHSRTTWSAGWIRRHSLGLTLGILLAAQTLYAMWSGAYVFSREEPFGPGVPTFGREFWAWWSWEYNISLVADLFGVLLIVMLSKWLYEQDSSESDESDDGGDSRHEEGAEVDREPAAAHR